MIDLRLPSKPKKRFFTPGRIILFSVILLAVGGFSYGAFFVFKTYSAAEKMNPEKPSGRSFLKTVGSLAVHDFAPLRGEEDGRINFLLLGKAGRGKAGQNLTDTLIIASVNTRTGQAALISLPRDLYVEVPGRKVMTKINSVYQYGYSARKKVSDGAGLIRDTVENITGLKIHYYLILDFEGFKKIVDSVGGINVMNERDIFDARYPGPNYSYETFELKKGFHHLNGETALKYVRERHDDPEGDFGRAKRQQQTMQAVKNKIFSARTLLNAFSLNELLNALGENIETDLAADEIPSLIERIKKTDLENINNVVADAWNRESLLKVSHIFYGDLRAFILVPRIGSWEEIRELSENIFDLNRIKRRKEAIAKENAVLAVLDRSGDARIFFRVRKLLEENLNYKNILTLNDPKKTVFPKSQIKDFTGGGKPFTLDEISKNILSVPLSGAGDFSSLPVFPAGKNPDFLIVIGKDSIERYNMEEDSVEEWKKAQDDQEQIYVNLTENKL